MVARLTYGEPLPAEVLRHVVTKTDGVPLFVEELTKNAALCALVEEVVELYKQDGKPLSPRTSWQTLASG